MSNNGSQTIPGTYKLIQIPMPDGSTIDRIVQQVVLPNGNKTWEIVDEKVASLEARFADTETKPAPWTQPNTNTLDPKTDIAILTPIAGSNKTKKDIEAYLVEALGIPTRSIEAHKLDEDKYNYLMRHRDVSSLLYRLCITVGGKWSEVARFLPKPL